MRLKCGKREDQLLSALRSSQRTMQLCRSYESPSFKRAKREFDKARDELNTIRMNRLRRVSVKVKAAKSKLGRGSTAGLCLCNHGLEHHPRAGACWAVNKSDGLLCRCAGFRMRGV